MEFTRSVRFNIVQRLFEGHAWITTRRGTRDQARNYCMKEDTRISGPYENGDWRLGGEGTRTDILAVADRVQQGATASDVASEFPCTFIKYHRGVEKLVGYSEKQRTQPPEIIICYGPTGTGKTKHCYDKYPRLYRKPCDTRWFDRYNGQTELILDDFGGAMSKMSLLYLLQILDRYPMIVEAKGTYINMMATTIVITTNIHPRLWYNYDKREESYKALERRIHQVLYFPKFGVEAINCDIKCFFQNFYEGMEVAEYVIPLEEDESSDDTVTTEEQSDEEPVLEIGVDSDDEVEYLGETSLGDSSTDLFPALGKRSHDEMMNSRQKLLHDAFVVPRTNK